MYWALIFCNVLAPQMMWFRKLRHNIPVLFLMAMIVNVGMWLERYVIIVVSLSRDFLPSSWGMYKGTVFDWSMFLGSIGLFLALLFLFIRLLPMISIFEMRAILPEAKVRSRGGRREPDLRPDGRVREPERPRRGDPRRRARPGSRSSTPTRRTRSRR